MNKHQFPAVVALLVVRFRPPRHACQSHAVPDDVANLSIRQVLRFGQTQVWNPRVEIAAVLGLSGAVRSMAHRATIRKTFACFLQNIGRGFQWICLYAGLSGNGEVARCACHDRLEVRRLTGGAKAMPNHARSVETKRNQCDATKPY